MSRPQGRAWGRWALRALWLVTACSSTRSPAPEDTTPRLVSLVPAFTETIAALDASHTLIGRSDWCNLPPKVAALPTFGTALTPALEPLARAAPTAVLVDASGASREEDIARIAHVEALPWLTLDDVLSGTTRLGALVDRTEAAAALRARFQSLAAPPGQPAKSALLILGEGTDGREVWYVMPSSLHGAALHSAGATSAIGDPDGGPPVLSPEALITLNPERLLVLQPTAPGEDAALAQQRVLKSWSSWTSLRAVAQGNVAVIAGPAVLSTGPSILETRDALRDALASMP